MRLKVRVDATRCDVGGTCLAAGLRKGQRGLRVGFSLTVARAVLIDHSSIPEPDDSVACFADIPLVSYQHNGEALPRNFPQLLDNDSRVLLIKLAGGFIAQRALTLLYVVGIGVDTLAIALLFPLRERIPRESRASIQATAFGGGKGRIDLGRDLRELWATLRNPSLATVLLLWAAVSALATSVSFYGQSYMKEMLLPLTVIGAVGMAGNLLATIPARLAFRLEERFGDRLPLIAGSALIPAAVLGLGLAQMAGGALGRALVVTALIVVAVLIEGLYPLFSSAANHLCPSERRATVLSSGSMLFSLVMMVVFPVIGFLGDRLGLRWGFTAVGGLGTVLAAFLLLRGKTAPPRLRRTHESGEDLGT